MHRQSFLASRGRTQVGFDWILTGGLHIVGHGLVFIQADVPRIGANEPFIENPSRKLIEVIFFEGPEHAGSDLGRGGNLVQRNAAGFALVFEPVAECAHSTLSCEGYSQYMLTVSGIDG